MAATNRRHVTRTSHTVQLGLCNPIPQISAQILQGAKQLHCVRCDGKVDR